MAAISSENLRNKIGFLATSVAANRSKYLLLGGKRLEGLLKFRVFNEGIATNESKIGKYKSKSWIKKRAKNGRQVGSVDLEFTGELRDSIQVVQDKRDVFLAIVDDRDFAKAKGQESRRKKEIFTPTKDEVIRIEEYIEDLIEEDFDKFLKSL